MFRERTFRMRLLPLTLIVLGMALLAIETLRLAGIRHEPLTALGAREWVVVGSLIFGAACLWAKFPEHVGPDGLRGTDGIGRYHDVRWEEIQKVSSIFGFLWIRHGKRGKALCVPKFVDDAFGFRESVRRHAPEGNPLRTYLMSR